MLYIMEKPSSVDSTMKVPTHNLPSYPQTLENTGVCPYFLLQNFFFYDIIIVLNSSLFWRFVMGYFYAKTRRKRCLSADV